LADRPSAYLKQLIQDNPLKNQEETQCILDGDLEYGASRYARSGTYHAKAGGYWGVWQAIQNERGVPLEIALEALSPEGRRWYALWSLENGHIDAGIAAYGRYLAEPGRFGPFSHETVMYLEALLKRGDPAAVRDAEARLVSTGEVSQSDLMWAVYALILTGDLRAASDRLRAGSEKYHDDGNLWALRAVIEALRKQEEAKTRATLEALKHGVYEERVRQLFLRTLSLSPAQWESMRAPYTPTEAEADVDNRLWRRNPGARLRPSDEKQPHWFGGDTFRMPECWGCGHPIRQWFVLDLKEIEPLNAKLPSWGLFPLLGCPDCDVSMGRHDYEVDGDRLAVKLVNVGTNTAKYGEARSVMPLLPPQYARLEWQDPIPDPPPGKEGDNEYHPDWDRPQVAGKPGWTQEPLRVYCRTCREQMVFVAAMATVEDFGPKVWINNGSGYQYHFACNGCRTLSVIAQCT
jgi:hypothetical protein